MWYHSEPELLQAQGHDVVTYSRDNSEIKDFSLLRKVALLRRISWSNESYQQVRNLIRKEQPEIAHVYNTLALISPSVYYACNDEGIPVVQTLYNYRLVCPATTLLRKGQICEECLQNSLWRSVRYSCYRKSKLLTAAVAWMIHSHRRRGTWKEHIDAYIVPTGFMRHKLIEGGLPAEKIVVKPNFHPTDPGSRDNHEGFALYVGRLSPEKGVGTLLATWSKYQDLPPLKIIGNGPLAEGIKTNIHGQSNENIDFLGYLSHEKVIEYIKKSVFLILPSEWYEGFPHVILEAYGCGVPIIASRIGTLVDVVKDKKTGLLFDPGDPKDLASKIRWLLQDEEMNYQMGKAARAEFEQKYTAKRNYENLMNIYSDLVQE